MNNIQLKIVSSQTTIQTSISIPETTNNYNYTNLNMYNESRNHATLSTSGNRCGVSERTRDEDE